jgi:hypothetical protein
MADAAMAFYNGVHSIYPACTKLMYFVHMRTVRISSIFASLLTHCSLQNVQNKAAVLNNREDQHNFIKDIDVLSLCTNDVLFESVKTLFIKKWQIPQPAEGAPLRLANTIRNTLVDYVNSQWFTGANTKWYSGVNRNTCMNNNSLEATNKVLKDEITNYLLLPFMAFISKMDEWLRKHSLARDTNRQYGTRFILFNDITIATTLWNDAINWLKDKDNLFFDVDDDEIKTYVCLAYRTIGKKSFTKNKAKHLYEEFKTRPWKSFDKYATFSNNVYIIQASRFRKEKFTCTCHDNVKQFTCKHSLAIAMKINKLQPPLLQSIASNKKRGRPPKLGTAYTRTIMDLNEYLDDNDDNNDNNS